MLSLLIGATVFGIITTIAFIIAGNFFEGSYDDRVARINEHFTVWRVEWAIAMVAEVFAGVGLWGLGRWFVVSERGVRARAASLLMVVGLIVIATGVTRFVVSLGDAEYGADPGTWVDVLSIAGVIGLVLAALILAWLSWGSVVAPWACVVTVIFAALSLLTASPGPVYLPALTVYAAAGLWRIRNRTRAAAQAVH